MRWTRSLSIAALLCLQLSLTACVGASGAPNSAFVPCQHPTVVPDTPGLLQGLLDYADAIDTCNALNGYTEVTE